jgi:hypothetical protein
MALATRVRMKASTEPPAVRDRAVAERKKPNPDPVHR